MMAPAIVRPEVTSIPGPEAVSKLELSRLFGSFGAIARSSLAVIAALGVVAVIGPTGVPAKALRNVILNGPPYGPLTLTLPLSAAIEFRLARTSLAAVPAGPVIIPCKPRRATP